MNNSPQAENAQRDEPHHHDGPEHFADGRGAVRLNEEQENQNTDRRRHHIVLQAARYDGKPFQGGQHRNRRGNNPVSVNERCPEQADRDDDRALAVADAETFPPSDQRHERHDPAFAMIVDLHGDADIFDRGDDDKRPENKRERAQHHGAIGNLGASRAQHDFQRVERACPDIAVDNTKSRQGQRAGVPLGDRCNTLRDSGGGAPETHERPRYPCCKHLRSFSMRS